MADINNKSNKIGNIGKKIVKFFIELKAELKKVVWPDRKKLTQSTITVVTICLIAAVLIFSIDKVLSVVLGLVNFYPKADSADAVSNLLPTLAPQITSTINPTDAASETPVSTAVSSIMTSSVSTAASSN